MYPLIKGFSMNVDINEVQFVKFLIKAKQNTYAGSGVLSQASRTASKDLTFREGDWHYLDTYLGDFHFIGEEAVWYKQIPVWGMNYYGRMLVEKIPPGFGEFLKSALLQVPPEMPFRGPEELIGSDFTYTCYVEGNLEGFRGREFIALKGKRIYQLYFHGGELLSLK
jgi:hypothetical protein